MPKSILGSPLWSRQELGLAPPSRVRRIPQTAVAGITGHYTTGEELGRDDTFGWWRSIQEFHQEDRGWWDIAYGFGVDRFGNILEGRGVLIQGGHAGTAEGNRTVGVAFLGDDDAGVQDLTDEARLAIVRLGIYIAKVAANAHLPWYGHRDWKSTACPGDEFYGWLQAGRPLDVDPHDETIQTGRWGEAGPPVHERTPPSPPGPAVRPPARAGGLTLARFEMLKAERDSAGNPVGVGSRGPQVRAFQATLRGFGAKVDRKLLEVDGLYGPDTDEACRGFQRDEGLSVDGIAGPNTLGRLYGVD